MFKKKPNKILPANPAPKNKAGVVANKDAATPPRDSESKQEKFVTHSEGGKN